MRLHIRHDTCYRYAAPVSYTIQLLRLTPRSSGAQRVLDWTIEGPGRRTRQIDAYGNVVHLQVLAQPHREMRVTVHGTVDVNPLPDGRLHPEEQDGPPREAFLLQTGLTAPDDAVLHLAHGSLPQGLRGIDDALLLAATIRDRVSYLGGATDVTSTAGQALALGSGVCQDHAHLFLSCSRALGVPARYVSGYLHPGDTEHAASHAWVDVWLPGAGWTSLDVTHACFAGWNHCRVAVGRDYESASPVRGVRTGGGEEEMHVSVRVQYGVHDDGLANVGGQQQ